MRPPVTLDFETEGIKPRPLYPPKPASVAIHHDAGSEFLAWGHPTGNNTTKEKARAKLLKIWNSGAPVVHHHGKFDADVADVHLQLPLLPPARQHDTMFLAFLTDPHRINVSLAAVAKEELRRKAWKEGALKDWIIQNIPDARRKPKSWGAYIAMAPAKLVEGRAMGDARATHDLFKKLYKQVEKRGMLKAYEREQRIMPLMLQNERQGVRVALNRLRRDLKFYEAALAEVDEWVRKYLKAPHLDLDKGDELADALDEADAISDWVLTKKGNRSTAKQALMDSLDDKKLVAALLYRGALATCVRTFMRPWLHVANQTDGWIHTQWNQVRQDYHAEGAREVGAKTGRLSSTPNFQNIQNPDRMADILKNLVAVKLELPSRKLRHSFGPWASQLLAMPLLRDYIVPDDPDHVILVRDYNQQEFRILAHFEDGMLLDAYRKDPTLDVHNYTKEEIARQLGMQLDRRPVKDINFGLIYGMGLGKLAMKTGKEVSEVKDLKRAVLKVSNIKELNQDLKARAAGDLPIATWGGREYYCEEPKVISGRIRTFEYKLLNTLVQGSAADNTKEALVRYHELPTRQKFGGRFLLTVHDETVLSAPRRHMKPAMEALRRTMESVEFDLPMLSDGKYGATWGQLKKFNDERN